MFSGHGKSTPKLGKKIIFLAATFDEHTFIFGFVIGKKHVNVLSKKTNSTPPNNSAICDLLLGVSELKRDPFQRLLVTSNDRDIKWSLI